MAGGAGEASSGRWRLSARAVALCTHPLVVASLAVLVLNDHVLKARWTGPVTGITSDVAGLVLLPTAIVLLIDLVGRRPVRDRTVVWIAALVAIGFALVELLPAADAAYEIGLGVLGWPVRVLFGGGGTRVVATPDPWDLLALPAAGTVVLLWRRAAAPAARVRPSSRRRPRIAALVTVILAPALLATSPSPDTGQASGFAPGPLTLDAARPSRTVLVTVDAEVSTDDRHGVSLDLEVHHEPGQPALRVTSTATKRGLPFELELPESSDGGMASLRLEPCIGTCHLEVPITIELVDPASGTWTDRPAAFVDISDAADAPIEVKVSVS